MFFAQQGSFTGCETFDPFLWTSLLMVLSLTPVPEFSISVSNSLWVIMCLFLIFLSKSQRNRRSIIRGAPNLGKLIVEPYYLNLRIIEPTVAFGTLICVLIFLYDIPSELSSKIRFRRYSETSLTFGMTSFRWLYATTVHQWLPHSMLNQVDSSSRSI